MSYYDIYDFTFSFQFHLFFLNYHFCNKPYTPKTMCWLKKRRLNLVFSRFDLNECSTSIFSSNEMGSIFVCRSKSNFQPNYNRNCSIFMLHTLIMYLVMLIQFRYVYFFFRQSHCTIGVFCMLNKKKCLVNIGQNQNLFLMRRFLFFFRHCYYYWRVCVLCAHKWSFSCRNQFSTNNNNI